MEYDLVIRNGVLIDPSGTYTSDIAISGERIAAIGTELRGRKEIDAAGKYVVPGAIDGHVHMRTERDAFCYDDTFATGSVAAAFGGTTTIIDQVQAEYGRTLTDELDTRMALAEGQSCVDFAFHMNIREPIEERLAEIPAIVARGISSFKWFMAIPGWGIPDAFLQRGMFEVAGLGGLSIVHAENQGVILEMRRRAAAEGRRNISEFIRNYPAAAEAAAIALAMAMTETADGRTLIFHNTCTEGVAAIRAAKELGLRAYGEAGLAWLTHTDEVYTGNQVAALPFLLTPPIRDAQHCDALWRGLQGGALDIVSTDHAAMRLVPEDQAREVAAYFGHDVKAPPATPDTPRDAEGNRLMPVLPPGGVETRFPLLFSEGVRKGRLSLERWVDVCCTTPARIFDLATKGRLLPGYDADIVIFDPNARHIYSVEGLHSNTDYSVWEGWEVEGRVERTFSRGRMIVDGDQFLGSLDHGAYLARSAG